MNLKLPGLFFLSFVALTAGAASPFDYNEDGVIRCAVLSAIEPKDGLDLSFVCSDLSGMIKASKPGLPVKVSFERIKESKTILGWWYHPDSAVARAGLLDASYDFVFLAEKESIATRYPELFFEGVYTLVNNLSTRKTNVMLLMTESPPSANFRDKSILKLAALTYRVADGCGIGVIPAAFAWNDVMHHNILTGQSLLKSRANSFLAAAAIWYQISDKKVPKDALSTSWVVKKTAIKMAKSARDAVEDSIQKKHYKGPFKGVVRTGAHMQQNYMIYQPGAAVNPDLKMGLEYIFNAAGQGVVQRSATEWYDTGFDRHSAAFDLVYGTIRELKLLQDDSRYTSTEYISKNMPKPLRVVYNRNPVNDRDGLLTLRTLENLLMDGYNFARKNDCVFIPYQIAWARAFAVNPQYVKAASGKSSNDWTSYMLANMIYTSLTGRFQMPPQREKPHIYNNEHPRGYHSACAKIGWQCMRQLSELNSRNNTLIVGSESWFVDQASPGFLRLRLLEPPASSVRILCEPNTPESLVLSRNILEFTPENYNIEQSIRCTAVGTKANVFCSVLMRAESKDPHIDAVFMQWAFLLNYNEDEKKGFSFSKSEISLKDQSYLMLKPDSRPVDIVQLRIFQDGVERSSIYFSPNFYTEYPICLFPTKADLLKGECRVTLKALSKDSRFNNFEREFVFKINTGNASIPDIRVVAPKQGELIKGPAFVTAEAVVEGVQEPCELSVFCGKKRLGMDIGRRLESAIEMGSPHSRLKTGEYSVWAAVRLKSGLVVASEVHHLSVTEK